MIVFNLICNTCSTEFEGWFENSKEFANQKRKKMISCPGCNSNVIQKSLMAPNLSKKTNSKENKKIKKTMATNIKKFKKIIEKNFDYVGDKFPEEARKIHYGEEEPRSIHGEATSDEADELVEEGVDFQRIPWPKPDA